MWKLTVLKYCFAICLAFLVYQTSKNVMYLLASLVSLLVIFTLTNALVSKHKHIARTLNNILLLLVSVQNIVMRFGSSYISMIMITNLSSVQDLHGRTVEYVGAGILCVIYCCLPITEIRIPKIKGSQLLSTALSIDLAFTMIFSSSYSPIFAYISLGQEAYAEHQQNSSIINADFDEGKFFHLDVSGWTYKPEQLPEKPNIILIFTEGLSKGIIEDERGIMPNTLYLQNHSLSFNHYYNHTAATYRGLIGQLYSGYQRNNGDPNYLISIEDILKKEGYYTQFINTEPYNAQFTAYLRSLNFDNVIQTDDMITSGELSDKQAYSYLEKTVKKKSDQPTFTVIYTFHTHVSLDGVDEQYGDGNNAMLNKFHDNDVQLGKFMEEFNKSSWSNNTLLVYTTDHATYADDDFMSTFSYQRDDLFMDEIPLYFYYKGIEPEEIDANGLNSLSLAPTILDYLDISAPNYFLGESLFSLGDTNATFNTVFTTNGLTLRSTNSGVISDIDDATQDVLRNTINEYFSLKIRKPK